MRRRSLTVRPVALQGQLEETRYRKRDDGRRYKHESDAELWLVETGDGRRATLAVPRRGDGWTRDGRTYWLTNPPQRGVMSKRVSRRKAAPRRKAKRRPPRGYKTWAAYMASIRPNPGGRTMAKRKRRRSSSRRPARRRRRRSVAVALSNPRRARRRHRRNPPLFSMGGILSRVQDAAMGAAAVVGGEAATKYVRRGVLGMPDGETMSTVADLGVATALGMVAERFAGRQIARDLTVGGYACVVRSLAKQLLGDKLYGDILGDTGGRRRFQIRNGRVVPVPALNGYPGTAAAARLNGYPGTAAAARLNGYDEETEIYGG